MSSAASGMRRLSLNGEDAAAPEEPVSVSHSRRMPESDQGAALDGEAERKYCCQALDRPTANVRSQTRFVAALAGQSAAKASKSFHETRPFVETTFTAATEFVGLMPPRILVSSVNPVSSRFVAVLNALVPPNQ